MVRLFIGLIGLSVVVILVLLNSANLATFNLFGVVYSNVPVIAVALASFLLGILYAALYFLTEKVKRRLRGRRKERTAPPQAPGPAEPPPAV